MKFLLQNLTKLTQLSCDELNPILQLFIPLQIPPGTVLLNPNEIAKNAWFIGSGILRAYHTVEERKRRDNLENDIVLREATSWIVPEGGFLTDVKSFVYETPATYYVESLEPCKLYRLSKENYLHIQRLHPRISQSIFEHTLIMADFRVQLCNFRRPEERLALFQKIYPQVFGRVSVNVLASYLNIDPTTLSRLRSKKI